MKIKVSNLGTIKETELDLRPLTVIIGPNNSSKTYLAYSVYGLWQAIRAPSDPMFNWEDVIHFDETRALVTIDEAPAENWVSRALYMQSLEFSSELDFYFQDTSKELFKKTRVEASRHGRPLSAGVEVADARLRRRAKTGDLFALHGVSFSDGVFSFAMNPRRTDAEHQRQAVKEGLTHLLREWVPLPFVLPAERNALIIAYKLLSARRLRLLREGASRRRFVDEAMSRQMDLFREQGEIRYPQPIEDFLDFLTDIEVSGRRRDKDENSPFVQLAGAIENELASGGHLESRPTPLGGSELRFGLPQGPSIDLYNASSSIKQLTALLLYLRYGAAPNQLLIIDEPEMNLHPLAQAKLLEALAILVNLGVHVLLTTHSPYFMAHLANLSQGARTAAARKKQADHLYLRDPRALLDPLEVGAYEMRDNTLVSLADPDFGLRWDTLSDVFSDLQEKFFALEGLAHGKARKKK